MSASPVTLSPAQADVHPVRRKAALSLATLFMTVMAILATALPASAAAGDVIHSPTEYSTNQCTAAVITTLQGYPGQRDQKITAVGNTYQKGQGSCWLRLRVVYQDTRGVIRATPYQAGSGMLAVGAIGWRCYTESSLRRKDGSTFTVRNWNPNSGSGCNGVIQY